MHEAVILPLAAWANFYVIVGSSAGALTGLTFVVITLTTQMQRPGGLNRGIAAFTTPTVVLFGTVLVISALLSVPWPVLSPLAILLGLCGLAGMLYVVVVMRRQRTLDDYTPVLEDWLGYVLGPFAAYAALFVAALLLRGAPDPALFAIGGSMLLLLVVGLHNAWDVVTYIVVEHIVRPSEQSERKESPR